MSVASAPLNFFIIVVCDLWPTYNYPPPPLSFGNGRIEHLTVLFNDLLNAYNNIDKICDYVGQKNKFLCKLISCEVQEGAEYKDSL